jgi:hypothetical protein
VGVVASGQRAQPVAPVHVAAQQREAGEGEGVHAMAGAGRGERAQAAAAAAVRERQRSVQGHAQVPSAAQEQAGALLHPQPQVQPPLRPRRRQPPLSASPLRQVSPHNLSISLHPLHHLPKTMPLTLRSWQGDSAIGPRLPSS